MRSTTSANDGPNRRVGLVQHLRHRRAGYVDATGARTERGPVRTGGARAPGPTPRSSTWSGRDGGIRVRRCRGPGASPHTARRSCRSIASSGSPERSARRTSSSSSLNRQFRTAPSAVSRRRLHVPQNGWVTLEMTPISPAPSTKRNRSAGARSPARSTAASGQRASICRTTSAPGTSRSRRHAPWASRGMNSMNRTIRPVERANAAKSRISSSLASATRARRSP